MKGVMPYDDSSLGPRYPHRKRFLHLLQYRTSCGKMRNGKRLQRAFSTLAFPSSTSKLYHDWVYLLQ